MSQKSKRMKAESRQISQKLAAKPKFVERNLVRITAKYFLLLSDVSD